jgi:hypothetical protein
MIDTGNGQSDARGELAWAVAIFAARESVATLEEVVRSVVVACSGHAARIDVLVNGNRMLAQELALQFKPEQISSGDAPSISIWFIELGDKAHTWNTYVHRMYQGSELTFFIDGYAKPEANALSNLALSLRDNEHALAATGVPSCGRSAARQSREMQRSGGIHGNLFVLTGTAMDQIRRRGFRLPMGLYRTDPLMGAALNFGFDPAKNNWDPSRIQVQPASTWQFKPLQWWRLGDLKTHLKRMGRQVQGDLENLAVRDHLARRRQSPESLPGTARELVLQWWHGENGPGWRQVLRHPTWLLAIRRFREARDWSQAELPPVAIYRNKVDVQMQST